MTGRSGSGRMRARARKRGRAENKLSDKSVGLCPADSRGRLSPQESVSATAAGGGMRWSWLLVVSLASTFAMAQESMLQADFRREGERVSDACKDFGFKAVPGCAIELFTDHPLHIAAGSLPAGNGFGLGGAF